MLENVGCLLTLANASKCTLATSMGLEGLGWNRRGNDIGLRPALTNPTDLPCSWALRATTYDVVVRCRVLDGVNALFARKLLELLLVMVLELVAMSPRALASCAGRWSKLAQMALTLLHLIMLLPLPVCPAPVMVRAIGLTTDSLKLLVMRPVGNALWRRLLMSMHGTLLMFIRIRIDLFNDSGWRATALFRQRLHYVGVGTMRVHTCDNKLSRDGQLLAPHAVIVGGNRNDRGLVTGVFVRRVCPPSLVNCVVGALI